MRSCHATTIGAARPRAATPSPRARRAITPTRCARYSALPWMSLFMPSAGMVMPSSDFGAKRFFSASSKLVHAEHAVRARAGHRDADVGAALARRTRRPARSARPGCGTSRRPPSSAIGNCTLVMISSGSSAVSNRPLKKSSAAILRLLVMMVAPSAEHGGRIVGGGIVVGDRAADRAAVAHRRIADHAGELGERRDRLLHHRRIRDLGMARHRADRRASGPCSSMPDRPSTLAEVDEVGRLTRAAASSSGQRLAAGEELRLREPWPAGWPPAATVVGR